jgi:TRAP-type C4-dicarboxylate transport system substrate-binding protein
MALKSVTNEREGIDMRKVFGGFLFAALLAVGLGDMAGASEVHRFSYSMHDPANSVNTIPQQAWADRIRERTGGRVNIVLYPGGSLVGGTEVLDAVKTGAADIGWVYTSFFPGQFPITDAISLPLLGIKTSTHGTRTLWDLYEYSEALRKELANNNLKMLMMYTIPSSIVVTATKPVRTVEDVVGLKLRTPAGTPTNMLKAWGGIPILMSSGEIYQSLEKAILDGYIFEYVGINAFKLQEVSKYYTEVFVYVGTFLILMNQDSFNSLPEDLQKIIEEESGRATSMSWAGMMQENWKNARSKIISEGNATIIDVSGDALAAFEKFGQDFIQQWVDKNKSAAFDAQGYIGKLQELIEKNKD